MGFFDSGIVRGALNLGLGGPLAGIANEARIGYGSSLKRQEDQFRAAQAKSRADFMNNLETRKSTWDPSMLQGEFTQIENDTINKAGAQGASIADQIASQSGGLTSGAMERGLVGAKTNAWNQLNDLRLGASQNDQQRKIADIEAENAMQARNAAEKRKFAMMESMQNQAFQDRGIWSKMGSSLFT